MPFPTLGLGLPSMEGGVPKIKHRFSDAGTPERPASKCVGHPKGISFAAAGWLKMYYFGVAHCFKVHQQHLASRYAGSSAGSLVAAALILDLDFLGIRDFILDCVKRTHGHYGKAFNLRQYVSECMDRMLHDGDEKKLNGKLEVSVTTLPWCRSKRISEFRDIPHLRQSLLASCCMTPLAGMPFKLDGDWVFDGGLADWQPLLDGNTLTVSPFFFSNADIKPSRYVPLWWAVYPPKAEEFAWVFDLGYHDALSYMTKCGYEHPSALDVYYQNPSNDPRGTPPPTVRYARNPAAACDHPGCLEQITSRPPSPLDVNERSFSRFFGYNSVLRLVPCWIFDGIFLFSVFVLLRPFIFFFVYLELIARALVSGAQAALFTATCRVERAASARFEALCCLRSVASPHLLLRSLPLLGNFFKIDRWILCEQSVVYRFCVHFA